MYFDNKNSIDFVLGTLHAFAIKCVSAYIYQTVTLYVADPIGYLNVAISKFFGSYTHRIIYNILVKINTFSFRNRYENNKESSLSLLFKIPKFFVQ